MVTQALCLGSQESFPIGDCPEDLHAGVLDNPFGIPGQGCGYGYADISAQTGGLTDSARSSMRRTILTRTPPSRSHYSRKLRSICVSSGFFFVEGQVQRTRSILTGTLADAKDTGTGPENPGPNGMIDPGEGFFAFHRFVGHGPRDDVTDRHEFDVLVGLKER